MFAKFMRSLKKGLYNVSFKVSLTIMKIQRMHFRRKHRNEILNSNEIEDPNLKNYIYNIYRYNGYFIWNKDNIFSHEFNYKKISGAKKIELV
jgi:hypothetical protein